MYDLKMLEEIKSQEERIHFSSFDYNDAYTLGTMLRERGLTTPKPIAIRIVFDDIILYQSFLPGTDESNNQWMNRKQHTVERCHTSSLRAAVERELNGVKENWQQDDSRRSSVRPTRIRLAPAWSRAWAIYLPSPEPAPVTSAVWP